MEMDIARLAAQAAAFFAPFLPYLIKRGKIAAKKAFEKAGEKFTEEAWEQAEKLWGTLKPKLEDKPAAQSAIEKAVRHPENKRVQDNLKTNLEFQFEDIFGEDSSFARFVVEKVNFDDSSNITTRDQSLAIGKNINESNAVIGDRNIVFSHDGQGNFLLDPRYPQIPVQDIPGEELILAYLKAITSECSQLPLGIVNPRFLEKAGKDSIAICSQSIARAAC